MKQQLQQYRNRLVPFAMILMALFTACENEVYINAEYKETIVIYGLLDPQDSIQYIKVNKAYLNENIGALEAAKISDSLYLDSTRVELKRVWNGQIIVCTAEEGPKKDSGIFANNKNILWVTREKIYPNEEYEITVTNPLTKTKAVSTTQTVGGTKIRSPFIDQTNVFSVGPEYLTISYVAAPNAFAYDARFHVYYEEINTSDTNAKVSKMVTWRVVNNYLVGNNTTPMRQVPRLIFRTTKSSIELCLTAIHRLLLRFTWMRCQRMITPPLR